MTLRSLFTAGALVTFGMLVGRILGLLRETLLAKTFGTSELADMAIMLLLIPDVITLALLGGTASATLVPAFSARNRENALALMWQSLVVSLVVFTTMALLLFANEEFNHAFITTHISGALCLLFLTSLPLTALTSILTAWLQYRGRFTVIAFANAIFNGVVILALLFMPTQLPVLSVAIMVATLVRFFAHAYSYYRAEGAFPKVAWRPWQIDKALFKHYAATAGTGFLNMVPQYTPYLILAAAGGGVAIFNYAFKLMMMPAILGQGVIQMVLLPWLVHLRGEGSDHHATTLQCTWMVSLAMCLSLMLASHDVVVLCFGYGKMTADDVDVVATLFAIGVWALPCMLLTSVWQQIMYARSNAKTPLLANTLLAAAVVPACALGKWAFGLKGLAVMFVCAQIVPLGWMAYVGYRLGILSCYRPSWANGKITLMVVALWVPLAVVYHSLALPAVAGLLLAGVMGAVLLAAGLAFNAPVRAWALQRLQKR